MFDTVMQKQVSVSLQQPAVHMVNKLESTSTQVRGGVCLCAFPAHLLWSSYLILPMCVEGAE